MFWCVDSPEKSATANLPFTLAATTLTTISTKRGGEIFKQVQAVLPDQKPIDRTFINSWEDRRVVEAVKKTVRKKLVIAALWSETCFAQPAIHAMGQGYDV
jgi:nicotinamidase-related amidase